MEAIHPGRAVEIGPDTRPPRSRAPRPTVATRRCSDTDSSPSSAITPSSATCRSAASGGQRSQSGLGRRRVGVVAVDHQQWAVGHTPHLHAQGRTGCPPRPESTSANGAPHHSAAAAAAKASGIACAPRRASRTSPSPHGELRRNCGRRSASSDHPVGPHVGTGMVPFGEAEDGTRAVERHATNTWVVEVQHGHTAVGQRSHQLGLGPGHTLEVAEELDVSHGHAGHDAHVWVAPPRPTARCAPDHGLPFRARPSTRVRRAR